MFRTSASPASVIGLALVAVFSGRARGQDVDFPPSGKQLSQIEALAHADSNEASLHYYRGLGYWGKHKFDEADSALRLAMQLDPRYADAYLALAYLPYVRRDQLFDEEIRDRVPDAWKPRLEESNRFYQFNLEQTKEAQGPIEKAVALYPRAALGHYLLGRIGEELGRPADAKTHLEQFVALAPHRLDDLVSDAKQRLAKLP